MRPFLVLLVIGTSGCASTFAVRLREQRDTAALGAAASDYWTRVRWNDPARAGIYLETPEEKLRLARLLTEPRFRMTEANVVQVVVGDELPEDRRPERREGIAMVRIEAYDTRTNQLATQTIEQHWVRAAYGWRVDADASPLGELQPW